MQNGYALCTRGGLDAIANHLGTLNSLQLNALRGELCVGIHRDVEVTDAKGEHRPFVKQVFCAALPVSYTSISAIHWKPFATLVLEASYEATMCAAVLNAFRGASRTVFLTTLGGGAFGNDIGWVYAAMRRAFEMMSDTNLDVRIVSYGAPPRPLLQMAR